MGKKLDRRALRTRRALHEALISLMARKGFDAITIQEIIDKADVGRATFYAHYNGKESLLRAGFEALRTELSNARCGPSDKRGPARPELLSFSLAMFEHAYRHADIYRGLIGERGGVIIVNEIRRVLTDMMSEELPATLPRDGVSRELALRFTVDAFLTVLAWWLERKPKFTPAEINAMFRRLTLGGIGASIGAL